MPAFLDIETSYEGEITVIGVVGPGGGFAQWVCPDIYHQDLFEALAGTSVLYTYNGHRFDLPIIRKSLGLDLRKLFSCRDLMYDCWRLNLYGGLKSVERQLGIPRSLAHLDGRDAMRLWKAYVELADGDALETLLLYNREDVENLVLLKSRLGC